MRSRSSRAASTSTDTAHDARVNVDAGDASVSSSQAASDDDARSKQPPTRATTSGRRFRPRHPSHVAAKNIEALPEGHPHPIAAENMQPPIPSENIENETAAEELSGPPSSENPKTESETDHAEVSTGSAEHDKSQRVEGAVVEGGEAAAGRSAAVAAPAGGVWDTIVATYRDRPVRFVEDLLVRNIPGFVIEEWQKRFLKAVARGERRISVRAGHGVGKSAACSWALIWFMFTRYPVKQVCTAPTQSQLFDALFSEVKKWCNELPAFMRDQIEVFSDRIHLKASPENSFISARTSSAERPEAMAGVHSENVLLVCDEASAIPEAVFEAASGSMSGFTATTILISNPTRNTGLFFKTHHQLSADWFRLHVSCLDSKLVAPDFIRQIATTYGEGSNAYRVRVLGEFSEHEDDVLIAAELVDAAMTRDVVLDAGDPVVYGVDVARFGDDRTVLLKRQGNVVLEYKAWGGSDLMATVGRVMHEAGVDRPAEICVDSIGLGAGVADRLREQGLNVRDVNVAEMSALNPIAAKLRDDLWLQVKDWLGKRSCRLPRSEELRAELVGPTYSFLSNGKIKVEAKQDMKRRGLRSPDIADALCLTFAGAAALVGGRGTAWVKGKPLIRGIKGVV